MITFQNVLSETQVKNFILFFERVMFRSQNILVFVILTIP